LFGDPELTPIKGQLMLLLPQPEVKYADLDAPKDIYMFPRERRDYPRGEPRGGDWSLEPDAQQAARIFHGHKDFFARMK
jgi:D-amino-acid oxidase